MRGMLCVLAVAGLAAAQNAPKAAPGPGLTLTTTAFADGSEIPPKYTQSVAHPISPKLEWTHVPAGTASFALIMYDPDTALQKTTNEVLHWLVWNIPGDARELPEGVPAEVKLPNGTMQGKNQGGVVGYRGPGAPAAGPHHHYTWELYALDTTLNLGPDTTRAQLLEAMNGHILGKGVLEGRFHR